MKKTIQVLLHEIKTTLGRRSYVLITVGIPLLGILVFFAINLFKDQSPEPPTEGTEASASNQLAVEGYVDQAGLIAAIPPDLPADTLISFGSEDLANRALDSGDIAAYYVIPENYIENGELYYIRPDFTPFDSNSQDWVIRWTLLYNISGQDIQTASYIWHPMNVQSTNLSAQATPDGSPEDECLTPGYGCESNVLVMMLPLMMLILFFMFISISAGLLLRSVSTEKQNRTIETLLLSVHPRALLNGKVIGLGIVAVGQMLLWVGAVFVILRIGGSTINLPPGFSLPTSLLVWGLVLFIGGYAIYASLMAGLGALVPDIKAGSQASIIIMLPLLAGYMISVMPPVQNDPHGTLATILSIFPLSAPTVMMLRLTVGGVPTWQLILTTVLLFLTVILVLRAVARMFRAQNILSGQTFSPKRYFSVLLGRG